MPIVALPALLLFLAACSPTGQPTPTALPPDIVRPAQPTPDFPESRPPVVIATLTPTPAGAPASPQDSAVDSADNLSRFAVQPPPSLLGIVQSSTRLSTTPDGETVTALPAGATLTITGISEDGRYLAAYTAAGATGWVPRSSLVLFGDVESLLVVDAPFRPAAVATLLADAQQPVDVLDEFMDQLTATPSPSVSPSPPSQEETAAVAASANGTPVMAVPTDVLGVVTVERQGLNVRAGPGPQYEIVGRLVAGDSVTITGRTVTGEWLQIQTEEGVGWVSAAFVMQNADVQPDAP